MKLIWTCLSAAAAFVFFSSIALANKPHMMDLEGITLQMTEAQVLAAMKTHGYKYAGKNEETIEPSSSFADLVSIKKNDAELFQKWQLSSELRYDGERGHLSIRFTPFKDRTVVTSVILYANDVPRGFPIPDCQAFDEQSRQRYGMDEGVTHEKHASWHRPMMVDGQMKENGQQMGTNCSPRFSPTVNLYNPYARDLLLEQIDQALLE